MFSFSPTSRARRSRAVRSTANAKPSHCSREDSLSRPAYVSYVSYVVDRSSSYYNPTVAKRKSKSPSLFDRMESDANVIARPASGWGVTSGPNEERVSLHEAAQTRYLELRAVGHHVARAAGRARRAQAGAAPHPLHDVAAEPDGRRQASQVREGRRRRDGQLPSARRRRALRDARPHGAAVLAALSARRRLGQLRVARRRQRRGDALHGVPARAHQRRDADARSIRTPSRSGPTTTARARSRSCCRRASRTCWSTARPASPSAWRRTSRRTTSARSARRSSKMIDADLELSNAQLVQVHQRPGFSDRRADHEHAAGDPRDLQDRLRHRFASARPGTKARPRAAARRSTSRACRTPSTSPRSSSASPTSRSRASCRTWSTSRICRPTTCGLRWS